MTEMSGLTCNNPDCPVKSVGSHGNPISACTTCGRTRVFLWFPSSYPTIDEVRGVWNGLLAKPEIIKERPEVRPVRPVHLSELTPEPVTVTAPGERRGAKAKLRKIMGIKAKAGKSPKKQEPTEHGIGMSREERLLKFNRWLLTTPEVVQRPEVHPTEPTEPVTVIASEERRGVKAKLRKITGIKAKTRD